MVTKQRTREVAQILAAIRSWADRRPDVRAVAVAGSWAHDTARMDSDLDLVVLCVEPERYLGESEWALEIAPDLVLMDTRSWGPLTELRFNLPSHLEIDFGVAPLSWANTNPVDDGTREVV
ncbi:MAG: aminoglycoside 6-adenylyltransferase, partial [Thermomicrobiales bacterium]|nr:aminoglycoside 6-adenylyltransferase [Thermomicrobiales bacterium]